uniref:Acyl-CoA dehydrogenase family member 11-like n=1 Tax=Crassostrea virginica TaxID=6565 RepID=A0A8B8EUX3_CRAVI|nr:acyl-CoA dehydrogenase family member 11-like [Crassostrea virginica]
MASTEASIIEMALQMTSESVYLGLCLMMGTSQQVAIRSDVVAPEIAMIKVAAPNMAQNVKDRAIQAHGGAGLSDDFLLAAMFAWARVLRIADGPDEVHLRSISRLEYRKHNLAKL